MQLNVFGLIVVAIALMMSLMLKGWLRSIGLIILVSSILIILDTTQLFELSNLTQLLTTSYISLPQLLGYLAALSIFLYTVASAKIISQGNEALVERLGRYHRKLVPGINFIVPVLDRVVLEESVREQIIDMEPQTAITRDNLTLEISPIVFWRILELERAFYGVEDVEAAITNLVITTLRSEVGRMTLSDTFSSRMKINYSLLQQLDEASAVWGVKVIRVELQDLKPSDSVMAALESESAAESKRRAAILEAEGTIEAIARLRHQLPSLKDREVLSYLIAQRFIDASSRLSESPNTKVVFMDPKAISDSWTELISPDLDSSDP